MGSKKKRVSGNLSEVQQEKMFTVWCNRQLRPRNLRCTNIFSDFADGFLLLQLAEVLTGEKIELKQRNRGDRRASRIQSIEMIHLALECFRRAGNRFVNVSAEDIIDMNRRILLGMLWVLIMRYQIQFSVSASQRNLVGAAKGSVHGRRVSSVHDDLQAAATSDADTPVKQARSASVDEPSHPNPGSEAAKPESERMEDATPALASNLKCQMLEWVRERIAPYECKPLTTIGHVFDDGLVLCALLHSIVPDAVDMEAVKPMAEADRIAHALSVVDEHLGIPRVFDEDELISASPDEKTLLTYLSIIQAQAAEMDESKAAAADSTTVNADAGTQPDPSPPTSCPEEPTPAAFADASSLPSSASAMAAEASAGMTSGISVPVRRSTGASGGDLMSFIRPPTPPTVEDDVEGASNRSVAGSDGNMLRAPLMRQLGVENLSTRDLTSVFDLDADAPMEPSVPTQEDVVLQDSGIVTMMHPAAEIGQTVAVYVISPKKRHMDALKEAMVGSMSFGPRSSLSSQVAVEILTPSGRVVPCSLSRSATGKYTASFVATQFERPEEEESPEVSSLQPLPRTMSASASNPGDLFLVAAESHTVVTSVETTAPASPLGSLRQRHTSLRRSLKRTAFSFADVEAYWDEEEDLRGRELTVNLTLAGLPLCDHPLTVLVEGEGESPPDMFGDSLLKCTLGRPSTFSFVLLPDVCAPASSPRAPGLDNVFGDETPPPAGAPASNTLLPASALNLGGDEVRLSVLSPNGDSCAAAISCLSDNTFLGLFIPGSEGLHEVQVSYKDSATSSTADAGFSLNVVGRTAPVSAADIAMKAVGMPRAPVPENALDFRAFFGGERPIATAEVEIAEAMRLVDRASHYLVLWPEHVTWYLIVRSRGVIVDLVPEETITLINVDSVEADSSGSFTIKAAGRSKLVLRQRPPLHALAGTRHLTSAARVRTHEGTGASVAVGEGVAFALLWAAAIRRQVMISCNEHVRRRTELQSWDGVFTSAASPGGVRGRSSSLRNRSPTTPAEISSPARVDGGRASFSPVCSPVQNLALRNAAAQRNPTAAGGALLPSGGLVTIPYVIFENERLLSKKYTRYIVRTDPWGWTVGRRYSEFVDLDQQLSGLDESQRLAHLPPLPEKALVGNLKSGFVEERRRALELYLQSLLDELREAPDCIAGQIVRRFIIPDPDDDE